MEMMKLLAPLMLLSWASKVSAKNAIRNTHVVQEEGSVRTRKYDPRNHAHQVPADIYSPFQLYTVDSPGVCFLSPPQVQKLKEVGASKVMCPFGVLIIGTSSFKDVYMKMAANIVASILDPNGDGVPDDPDVIESLTYNNDEDHKGAVLSCGSTHSEESTLDTLGNVFDYSFSCQVWKVDQQDRREIDGVLMEEAFHMVHQEGYAWVYPDEFGLEDYTSSIVGRETARLECVEPGYFHPENECPAGSPRQPGNPAPIPLEGGCNYPSCDVAEFYKMALFLARGMGWDNDPNSVDVWASDYMPTWQQDVLDMLSPEFKNMINDPHFHQIQGPLTSEYNIASAANWFPPEPCMDDPNWHSEDELGQYYCSDYWDWEEEGCPQYGGDVGVDTDKTANEACCICKM